MLSDEQLYNLYKDEFNKALIDENTFDDPQLVALRAVAEAAVKDAVGGEVVAADMSAMNDALCDFARRWSVDGDYLRCTKCNRAHIASKATEAFVHASDCDAGGEKRPWQRLTELLRPLYTRPQVSQLNLDYLREMGRLEARIRELEQASAEVPDDVAKDAERYRWLKSRMVGVNFDWDDEGMTALAFEMPDNLSFCADCDKNIDSAMLAASQPEVKS